MLHAIIEKELLNDYSRSKSQFSDNLKTIIDCDVIIYKLTIYNLLVQHSFQKQFAICI